VAKGSQYFTNVTTVYNRYPHIFNRKNIFCTDVHLLLELLLSKTMFLLIFLFHNYCSANVMIYFLFEMPIPTYILLFPKSTSKKNYLFIYFLLFVLIAYLYLVKMLFKITFKPGTVSTIFSIYYKTSDTFVVSGWIFLILHSLSVWSWSDNLSF